MPTRLSMASLIAVAAATSAEAFVSQRGGRLEGRLLGGLQPEEVDPLEEYPRSWFRNQVPRETGRPNLVPYWEEPTSYDLQQYSNESPTPSQQDPDRALAAGMGTAAIGLLVGGPIGAAVLGFSSAYAAEHAEENTIVGDSARAIGDVAIAATRKSIELNEKHRVVDKTIQAGREAWNRAKELDREYKLVQKAKDVALYGSAATVEFVQKHNLVERSIKGIGMGIGWVAERVVAGSLDGKAGNAPSPNLRSAEDQGPPTPPPRKRGRPRKNPLPEATLYGSGQLLMPPTPYDQYPSGSPKKSGSSKRGNNRRSPKDETDLWAGQA